MQYGNTGDLRRITSDMEINRERGSTGSGRGGHYDAYNNMHFEPLSDPRYGVYNVDQSSHQGTRPLMELPLEHGNHCNSFSRGNIGARGGRNRRWDGDGRSNHVPNIRQTYDRGIEEPVPRVSDFDGDQRDRNYPIHSNMYPEPVDQLSVAKSRKKNIEQYSYSKKVLDLPMKSQYDEWVEYHVADPSRGYNRGKRGKNQKSKASGINPSSSDDLQKEIDIEESLGEGRHDSDQLGSLQLDENPSGRGRGRRGGSGRGSGANRRTRRGLTEPFILNENDLEFGIDTTGEDSSLHSADFSVGNEKDLSKSSVFKNRNKPRRGRGTGRGQDSARGSSTTRSTTNSTEPTMMMDNASECDGDTVYQAEQGVSGFSPSDFDYSQQGSAQRTMNTTRRTRGSRRGFGTNRSRRGHPQPNVMSEYNSDCDVDSAGFDKQVNLSVQAEDPIIEFDSTGALHYLLNEHHGSCTILDFKANSGLFAKEVTTISVIRSLIGSRKFFIFQNPASIDQSIVKVHSAIRSCMAYSSKKGCTYKNCFCLHLCRNYLARCCFSRSCTLSHDLSDGHNAAVIKKHELQFFSESQQMNLLRCSSVFACCAHNTDAGCLAKDSCCDMHVCKEYILGKCLLPSARCIRGHDLTTAHNFGVLSVHKMSHLDENIILRNIFVVKEPSLRTRWKEDNTLTGESTDVISSKPDKKATNFEYQGRNSSAFTGVELPRSSFDKNLVGKDLVNSDTISQNEFDKITMSFGRKDSKSGAVKQEKVYLPLRENIKSLTEMDGSTCGLPSSVQNLKDQIDAFNLTFAPIIVPVYDGTNENPEISKNTIKQGSESVPGSLTASKLSVTASVPNSAAAILSPKAVCNTGQVAQDPLFVANATCTAEKTYLSTRNCGSFDSHECFNDKLCSKRHGVLPYLWRIKTDDQWASLDQLNSNIELVFSNPDYKKKSFMWQVCAFI